MTNDEEKNVKLLTRRWTSNDPDIVRLLREVEQALVSKEEEQVSAALKKVRGILHTWDETESRQELPALLGLKKRKRENDSEANSRNRVLEFQYRISLAYHVWRNRGLTREKAIDKIIEDHPDATEDKIDQALKSPRSKIARTISNSALKENPDARFEITNRSKK